MLGRFDVLREPPVTLDGIDGPLSGAGVTGQTRVLADLAGLFADEGARLALPADRLVYRVQAFAPDQNAAHGSLCYGMTFLEPGIVGSEYYMTKGHFHANREAAEIYWCGGGEGLLVLMDETRNAWAERMFPGSLHYIGPHTAHRLVNTGDQTLCVRACWPGDAGHDYDTIAREGFSVRVLRVDGKPAIVGEAA